MSLGTATLRAVLEGSNNSVLEGGAPGIDLSLKGSHAIFDPALGSNGRLIELLFETAGTINLDLDEALIALDTVSIEDAIIFNDVGATADLNQFNQFNIDTVMQGMVSGTFPPPGGSFGPVMATSTSSQAGGAMIFSANEVTMNLLGVNIARFGQLAGAGPDVLVTADLFFTGNSSVPEPSTGLLQGLGFLGLGLATRRTRSGRRPVASAAPRQE